MPYRGVYSLIFCGHFLNCCFLFSDISTLCLVGLRTSQGCFLESMTCKRMGKAGFPHRSFWWPGCVWQQQGTVVGPCAGDWENNADTRVAPGSQHTVGCPAMHSEGSSDTAAHRTRCHLVWGHLSYCDASCDSNDGAPSEIHS